MIFSPMQGENPFVANFFGKPHKIQINHPSVHPWQNPCLAMTSPTLKKNFPRGARGKEKRKREQRVKGEKRKGVISNPVASV